MNRIIIEAVPQSAMRPPYDQEANGAGDWLFDAEGNLVIRSSGTDLSDPETFLFALHELCEAVLCFHEGVSQEEVDAFDRAVATHGEEPGDHPQAPYRTQHRRAMLVEHLMANFLGLTDYGTVS